MHHTITDGVNGVRMSMQYVDLTRDVAATGGRQGRGPGGRPGACRRVPWSRCSATPTPRSACRSPSSARSASCWPNLDRFPRRAPPPSTDSAARSPSCPSRTRRARRCGRIDRCVATMEVVRVPMQSTRDAAKRLGGSLNAAFLTACAEAAHHYHVRKGAPVDELRATMAVSTRTKESGANAFGLVKLLGPDRRDDDRRALLTSQRARRSGSHVGPFGVDGHARRDHLGAAHVAAHTCRPAAIAKRRLRHVQRAHLPGAVLHRRRQGPPDLRHRTARRRGLQRHDALVREAPRSRHQHRHRRRRGCPTARQPCSTMPSVASAALADRPAQRPS